MLSKNVSQFSRNIKQQKQFLTLKIIRMFLEQQISILEWFLKDHVTEDWSNDAENSAVHHRNKYILK